MYFGVNIRQVSSIACENKKTLLQYTDFILLFYGSLRRFVIRQNNDCKRTYFNFTCFDWKINILKKNILITGGTGLIGTCLCKLLTKQGHNVRILSRNKKSKFYWNPKQKKIDEKALDKVDVVVNLCGLSVDRIWKKKNKLKIL